MFSDVKLTFRRGLELEFCFGGGPHARRGPFVDHVSVDHHLIRELEGVSEV